MSYGKQMVLKSRFDAQQQEKDDWLEARLDALNFYKGRTEEYVRPYFSRDTLAKVSISNINICKRIIERISLAYMIAPNRIVTYKNYNDYVYQKDMRLQKLERYVNLLEVCLIKPCWRNARIEFDIIMDFEPSFSSSDPMNPTSIEYPLATRSTVLDKTPTLWSYWSEDEHYIYDKNDGRIIYNEDNPENLNPYRDKDGKGIIPIISVFRDGKPETHFLDTDASSDICKTNLNLLLWDTTRTANIFFQSFGYLWISGEVDNSFLEVAPDKITRLQVDSQMGVVTPPDTTRSIDECVRTSYKMLAQNYHLSTSFVDGSEQASSGISLKIRNRELNDSHKNSLERYRAMEQELFIVEKAIIKHHTGVDIGSLELVDFKETEVLSDDEQRAKFDYLQSKGIIDEVDICLHYNPDLKTRERAEEYLSERKKSAQTIKEKSDTENNIFKLGA